MSLFSSVFISHKKNGAEPEKAEAARVPESEDFAHEEALDSCISADIGGERLEPFSLEDPILDAPQSKGAPADVTVSAHPVGQESEQDPHHASPPAMAAPAGSYDPLDRADIAPRPAQEQALLSSQQRARALDPQLVERAVRAQSEIEKTQIEKQAPRAPHAPKATSMDGLTQPSAPPPQQPVLARAPMSVPTSPRARRVRTRMLGFGKGADAVSDPFENTETTTEEASMSHPVGWIVVTQGPGEGQSFPLHFGVSTIGRGSDQSVVLDFGDSSISRRKHAAIAYDDESNAFFLGHGGKSNIVRLNGRPVLSTEDLRHGDSIKIGETTLRFVALCGPDFIWSSSDYA